MLKIAYCSAFLSLLQLPAIMASRVSGLLESGSIVRRLKASYTRILLLHGIAGLNSVGLGSLNCENGFALRTPESRSCRVYPPFNRYGEHNAVRLSRPIVPCEFNRSILLSEYCHHLV